MKAIAKNVILLLSASADLQAEIEGRQAWELESEDAKLPFVTFSITELPGLTKDVPENYNVRINTYAKSLDEASDIDQLVKAAINAHRRVKSLGAQSGYTDEEARKAVIIRTFNLK